MAIITVGILSEDMNYGKALAKGLSREASPMEFFVMDKNSWDSQSGLDIASDLDMVLTDMDICGENIIRLMDTPQCENIYGESPFAVFRYKKSRSLINDLLFVYFKLTGKRVECKNDEGARIIAFGGMSGGAGTTSTAIATAIMMHRLYGKRSIYLNVSPLDDSMKYLGANQATDIVKLLYYLESDPEGDMNIPVESFINEYCEGLDYLSSSLFGITLNSASQDTLMRLLGKIQDLGKYECVIVDMGTSLTKFNSPISTIFDKVILTERVDKAAAPWFTENISPRATHIYGEENLFHINTFFGPIDYDRDYQSQFLLEYDEGVFVERDGLIAINLSGGFGTQIKELVIKLEEGMSDDEGRL